MATTTPTPQLYPSDCFGSATEVGRNRKEGNVSVPTKFGTSELP